MEGFAQDLRYGWRSIRRSSGSSVFILLLLAVGIGLDVAVFAALNALLLRPLPVRRPEKLVRLVQVRRNLPLRSSYTYRGYEAVKAHAASFSDVIAYSPLSTTENDDSGGTTRVWCEAVTGDYFIALGVRPLHGRLLSPVDASTGAYAAVLGYQYWQRRFHGDPAVIGRPLRLGRALFTIVGVTPREFNGIDIDTAPDVRVPLPAADRLTVEGGPSSYRHFQYEVVTRLRPGVAREAARAEAESLFRAALEEEITDAGERRAWLPERIELQPLRTGVSQLRDRYAKALVLLFGGVALLVVLICANVGGLLVGRAAARGRETAVRLALGAPASRLIRMCLTESFLLTGLGGAVGLGIAWMATPLFDRVLPPLRRLDTTRLLPSIDWRPDFRVVAFALGAAIACALLAGLPAAVASLRWDLYSRLRAPHSSARDRLRWTLVATQAALATVVVAASGLLVSTLHNLRALDAGFDRDRVVTFSTDPGMLGYTPDQTRNLAARLMDSVRAMPQVESAAVASIGVMRGSGLKTTVAPAGEKAAREDFLNTSIHVVSPEYFETMGIRFEGGRNFRGDERPRDLYSRAANPEPVVGNLAFARRFFRGADAVGRSFGYGSDRPASPDCKVVGIVADAKYRSLREPVPPTFYRAWTSAALRTFILHVRARNRPEDLIEPIRRALAALEPRLSFYEVHTLAEEVEASLWSERALARISLAFGALGAAIAIVGVYGTVAYAVAQGKREIGIRMALGAAAKHVLWASTSRSMVFLVAGTALGITTFLIAASSLRDLLYGVEPRDPLIAMAASAATIAALVAAALPAATTALRVDPAHVLREE